MSAFDEREKAFEAKYHLDEEIAFKVNARRDKLMGLWAAGELGLTGDEAEAYAKSVVEAGLADAGHKTLLAKLHADLSAKKVDISDGRLELKLEKFHGVAHQDIVQDVADGKLNVSAE